jgi:RNA polymerase sigma-70 factor (ECF subfamily)
MLPAAAPHHDTDRLIARIAHRDPRALAELHQTLNSQVCHAIAIRLRDPEQIRAVTAATFVEVWHMAGTINLAPGGATDWILTIANRRATERGIADAASDAWGREIAEVHDTNHLLELHRHLGSPLNAGPPQS